MSRERLHVAIVGGGLCGLSLAIALSQRSISYTIYEARSSFTEIGAGINLGPNTIQAFNLIDPVITEALLALGTKNEPGKENVWMNIRLGAPTSEFEDGHLITSIIAPNTAHLTTSRNELLQILASNIQLENARFNKKLADVRQTNEGVAINFEDGTKDTASLVIGCDGAHSTVRRLVLGPNNPATTPKFSHTGGYRAVFPLQVFADIVGADKARMSTIRIGPGGYIVHYPIDGGKNVNVGLWPWKPGEWEQEDWVLHDQKKEMVEDFKIWGEITQRLMAKMDDDTAFWATFHHSVKPDSYFSGRVCIIGDSAHSMCPHAGQGAAQSMEDACVMAEVLQTINTSGDVRALSEQIQAAFSAYESVRKPRFERVLDTSMEAFSFWSDFWRRDLSAQNLENFDKEAGERFQWIWNPDIEGQGMRAKAKMQLLLKSQLQAGKGQRARLA